MNPGLGQLFEMMSGEEEPIPLHAGNLFGVMEENEKQFLYFDSAAITIVAALHSDFPVDVSVLPPNARRLYEISGGEQCAGNAASANAMLAAGSPGAFYGIVRAWMSELPVTAEIVRFGRKVLAAAGRREAYLAATDRGDPDVQAVEAAAYRVWHEFDRLRGLLRFSPDANGEYIARCEPDHFVLPALGPHFRERFGQTPWAIIDEKRRLCLRCDQEQALEFFYYNESENMVKPDSGSAGGFPQVFAGHVPTSYPTDEWEDLWRLYHKTINNESRSNPELQKQFMPKRYWKYLTEM